MINSELNIKTIPLNMLELYFLFPNNEETCIVDHLKNLPENIDNFNKMKKMYETKNLPEPNNISQEEYKKLLNKFNTNNNKKFRLPEFNCNPLFGEIWSLKKKISLFKNDTPDYVAQTKYVYILTNPDPYVYFTGEMYETTKNYKELYTSIVLPISFNIEFATHEDYIIKENNDFLGIEFMIQTGIESNLFVSSLDTCVGKLSKKIDDQLMAVYFASNGMEFDKNTFDSAPKGKIFEDEYGDNYEFKLIEEENMSYYENLIGNADNFFSNLIINEQMK